MDSFLLGEKYRLEVLWDSTIYTNESKCMLINARFSGPALKIAQEIQPNDAILVDFYKQYYIFTKGVYVAKLSWKDVVCNSNGTVTIKEAVLAHDTELNNVPKLGSSDCLVIDTSNHEDSVHYLNPTYITYVVSKNDGIYDFWKYHGSKKLTGAI